MSVSSSSFFESLAGGRKLRVFLLCLWVLTGFISSQLIIIFLWRGLIELGLVQPSTIKEPVIQLSLLAVGYVLALIIVVSVPKIIGADASTKKDLPRIFATDKKPCLLDIGVVIPGYFVYLFLTVSLAVLLKIFFPAINLDQLQEVGFHSINDTTGLVIAFIGLVIIPPIAEELLFRGYLYGYLRRKTNVISATLLVSLLFAISHFQLNVAIDVFALSLVLCAVREYTGKLWACILLHMTKNAVAFTLVFVKPDLLQLILKG